MLRSLVLAGLCLFAAGVGAGAQVESAASQLEAASALTSLDGIDAKPWHLKLEVSVIDETKVPNQGTIDVWHAGTDERTVFTFGDSTRTTLKHDGKMFYGASGPMLPSEVEEMLQEFVHPGPRAVEMDSAVPELRKHKFGKDEFDCVMLTQPIKGSSQVPLGLFPTYCMSKGVIRIRYNFGGETVVLKRIGTFLGHSVAVEAAIQRGEAEVATGKVVGLTTYTPVPDEFLPSEKMVEASKGARISGSVIAGNRVSFAEPVFPDSAKIGHKEGTVILHAIIGRDGRIRSLRPVSASDPDFVISAIAAVRQWKYRPYLLNGVPVEVDTTITVNFRLN